MVIFLADKLDQLLLRIFRKSGSVIYLVDQRNFGPDDKTCFVAKRKKIIRVRIVRQPDTGGADFHNHVRVFILVCVTDCPSLAGSILMAVNAMRRIRLAIE